ncbi:hypothetical protein SRHO_G00217770 [Serrasalmus rhombeus]
MTVDHHISSSLDWRHGSQCIIPPGLEALDSSDSNMSSRNSGQEDCSVSGPDQRIFPNDSIVNRCSDARQQQTQCPVTTAATLRAEVLWCLGQTKHHSFNSNEGIGELFRNMFPDSDMAKSFALGKDKTAYFIKFGIAPCFKKQLVKTINKARPFVLMFDEGLNQS